MTTMHTNTPHSLPVNTRGLSLPILSWLMGAFAARDERRRLANLDDHMLDDLGLSYRDARHEASKPFWNVPAHWLR